MAASYIAINSRFRPFSYEEMVRPLAAMEEAHRELEDIYDNLELNAGSIGSQLDGYRDPKSAQVYSDYMHSLNTAANDLMKNGINTASRNNMLRLRKNYATSIVPIQSAVTNRAAAIQQYNEKMAKDPSLITDYNPSLSSVDSYLNGNIPTGIEVSGNDLMSRGLAQGQAYSKRINDPDTYRLVNELGGQYFAVTRTFGVNSPEAQAFLEDISSIPQLEMMVESIMESSGASQFAVDENGIESPERTRARQYIIEGIMAGLTGGRDTNYLQNQAFGMDLGEEEPEVPQQNPVGMIRAGLVKNARRKDYNKALDLYNRYVGPADNDDSNPVDTTVPVTTPDGEMFLGDSDLVRYAADPEAYEQNYNEVKKEYASRRGTNPSSIAYKKGLQTALSEAGLSLSPQEMRKKYEEQKKKFDELYNQYSYLSDDKVKAVKLGVSLALKDMQEYKDTYTRHSDATSFDKWIGMYSQTNTPDTIYKFDRNTSTKGKKLKPADAQKVLDEYDKYTIQLSKWGHVLISDSDGNLYVAEGNSNDIDNQKRVEALLRNGMYFGKNSSDASNKPEGYHLIGRGSEANELVYPGVDSLPSGYNVADIVDDDLLVPIVVNGQTSGYKLSVSNEYGDPVNVILGPDKTVYSVINGTEYATGYVAMNVFRSDLLTSYADYAETVAGGK